MRAKHTLSNHAQHLAIVSITIAASVRCSTRGERLHMLDAESRQDAAVRD